MFTHSIIRFVRTRELTSIAMVLTLVSIVNFVYYFVHHEVLLYADAVSHEMISAHIADIGQAGQSGDVWLPLTHWIQAPFMKSQWLYLNGLPGAILSMISYVLTGLSIYRLVQLVTQNKLAALGALVCFAANPNVLYLQSTTMTELPMLFCITTGIYFLVLWAGEPKRIHNLIKSATIMVAGSLIRYECWFMIFAMTVAIATIGISQRWHREKTIAVVICFIWSTMFGVLFWIFWNWSIFGSPIDFLRGEYATPNNWVKKGDPVIGNWVVSIKTYWYAMEHLVRLDAIILGAFGLVGLLLWKRFAPTTIALLVLLFPLLFMPYMLESGNRPLNVDELEGKLYNVRFAIIMVVTSAVYVGIFISFLPRFGKRSLQYVIVCLILVMSGWQTRQDVITLREAHDFFTNPQSQAQVALGTWLRHHYDESLLLMENHGNELFIFTSQIRFNNVVDEGRHPDFERDLNDPRLGHIGWIFMRGTAGDTDKVYKRLYARTTSYQLEYKNKQGMLFHRERT